MYIIEKRNNLRGAPGAWTFAEVCETLSDAKIWVDQHTHIPDMEWVALPESVWVKSGTVQSIRITERPIWKPVQQFQFGMKARLLREIVDTCPFDGEVLDTTPEGTIVTVAAYTDEGEPCVTVRHNDWSHYLRPEELEVINHTPITEGMRVKFVRDIKIGETYTGVHHRYMDPLIHSGAIGEVVNIYYADPSKRNLQIRIGDDEWLYWCNPDWVEVVEEAHD